MLLMSEAAAAAAATPLICYCCFCCCSSGLCLSLWSVPLPPYTLPTVLLLRPEPVCTRCPPLLPHAPQPAAHLSLPECQWHPAVLEGQPDPACRARPWVLFSREHYSSPVAKAFSHGFCILQLSAWEDVQTLQQQHTRGKRLRVRD
eukprot:655340-Rhodomonas_salina.3